MADFTDLDTSVSALGPLSPELPRGDPEASSASFGGTYETLGGAGEPEEPEPSVVWYHQRIWDLTLGAWVYYALTEVNASPLVSETTPNHSGNLKLASHEVFKARKV